MKNNCLKTFFLKTDAVIYVSHSASFLKVLWCCHIYCGQGCPLLTPPHAPATSLAHCLYFIFRNEFWDSLFIFPWLAWDWLYRSTGLKSAGLCLPRAGIKCVTPHSTPLFLFLIIFKFACLKQSLTFKKSTRTGIVVLSLCLPTSVCVYVCECLHVCAFMPQTIFCWI